MDGKIKPLGLVISVILKQNDTTENIIINKIERVMNTSTFREILQTLLTRHSQLLELDDCIQVCVASQSTWTDEAEIDIDESVDLACSVINVKYLRFTITRTSSSTAAIVPTRSITEVMMESVKYPKKIETVPPKDKLCELYNAVVEDMQGEEKLLRGSSSQIDASEVMKKLTNALWYLDGRAEMINEASRKRKNVTPLPDIINKYQGYQRWKEWKKKPRLDQSTCQLHSKNLLNILDKRCILWPSKWREDILQISSSLSSYVTELSVSNDAQQERQLQLHPARELSKNADYRFLPPVEKQYIHKEWIHLSEKVNEMDMFQPLLVDDDFFEKSITPRHRLYLFSILALEDPVQMIKYDAGGGCTVMYFVQKIPGNMTDDEKASAALRMVERIKDEVPIYHTRAMRKIFNKNLESINSCNIQPHIRRHIYRELTGDASREISSAEIDHRLQLAIETNDPDLIIDLRHLNEGRPGNTFDVFFLELERVVEEITAADERRHGISHMSEFLSVKDLISQVKERLPPKTLIPSESTVIHAFAPPNMHSKTAQYYTGRINLKHTVQRRQLRAFHVDAHWCNALYRYLRELAIKNRDSCTFISCDDKAKVVFGEPGSAISTGVRGKKTIVPTTSTLGALDHDVDKKGSIVPTVTMICDIPEDISGSFYRGSVHVTFKESVFQPSCSYRAVVELIEILRSIRFDKKHLYLMTDGGPEHRVCFDSVKIPLIMLFKEFNLDSLVAIRTAPGHSYTNIVERIMSILNIGFQNVALERSSTASDPIIDSCKNLDDLRKHESEIKKDWQKSVQPIVDTLISRTERLSLKDIPFQCHKPSTDKELDSFIEKTAELDPELPTKKRDQKLQKKELKACQKYQDFLKAHCNEGHYAFQIRKCEDKKCCERKELVNWLPYPIPDDDKPGHYKSFNDISNTDPTEKYLPSFINDPKKVAEEIQGCKSSTLTAQNVRDVVKCSTCKKPRCIYATRALSNREMIELRKIIKNYDYVCGCMIAPETSFLKGSIFSRLELHCNSPIESMYYGAPKLNKRKDLCCHCGKTGVSQDTELKRQYKTVIAAKGRGKKQSQEDH